jgi:hypothetical protein
MRSKRASDVPAAAPAPRARQMLATAIDVALGWAIAWRLHDRPTEPRAGGRAVRVRWITVVGPSSELVRQQLGSPGQRVARVRTVDRRTGARVALWRTLVVILTSLAGDAISKRHALGDDPELERKRLAREALEIREGHADDVEARNAALLEHYRQHRQNADLGSRVAPLVAVGLLTHFLRRRLTPTIEVSVRPGAPAARARTSAR